ENRFTGYYINFQLPFQRSKAGFDTLDLELDIVIKPTYEWLWKDIDGYREGIERGIIRKEWAQEIETAKQEVLEKIEKRLYPFDGAWLSWIPDPNWQPPALPENWDKI
ncbi:MAG: DUF402 domain-containing protein, partial [Chloroflexota bacterium]